MASKPRLSVSLIITAITILGIKPTGRYTLSKYTNLSLARSRSLLNYLVDTRLAYTLGKSSGKYGTALTELGKEFNIGLGVLFKIFFNPKVTISLTDFLPKMKNPVIVFFEHQDEAITGLYERDIAVRHGASGAITLVKLRNKWQFPDGYEIPESFIHAFQIPRHFNCCVIVFGKTLGYSTTGAVSIVEYHLFEEISQMVQIYINTQV